MKTEQPLWGRGQMISPQHFQQQAGYAAWSADGIARMGLSHPWGIIDVTFEPDALKLGRLQARHLHVRFPDGTLIDTDNADPLPPVLSLENASQDATVVLALPLLRANGGNCLKPDEVAERPVRFRQQWRDIRNAFGDDTRQISISIRSIFMQRWPSAMTRGPVKCWRNINKPVPRHRVLRK